MELLFYEIPDSWLHTFSLNNHIVLLLFKEEQRAITSCRRIQEEKISKSVSGGV